MYDGSSWTTIDYINPTQFSGNFLTGISGNQIVGYEENGFIATIPEPSGIVLASLDLIPFLFWLRRGGSQLKVVGQIHSSRD